MTPTKDEIQEFSLTIKRLVNEKSLSYMEAVVYHCDKKGIEIELAAKLLNHTIKAKLEQEAQDLKFIKKRTKRIPI
jgi:hypothetical protein